MGNANSLIQDLDSVLCVYFTTMTFLTQGASKNMNMKNDFDRVVRNYG